MNSVIFIGEKMRRKRRTHIGVEIKIFFESWIGLEKLTFPEYSGRLPLYKEKSHSFRPAVKYVNICTVRGMGCWHGGQWCAPKESGISSKEGGKPLFCLKS